jgi:hypothetical protein
MPCDELNIDFLTIFGWHQNNKSLDTKEVKNIRYKEGLETLLKITGTKIPVNYFTCKLYSYLSNLLLLFRRVLKYEIFR